MKHVFLIDPLEKLNLKKDTSLFLAKKMQDQGDEVYLLDSSDLYLSTIGAVKLLVATLTATWKEGGPYLESFAIDQKLNLQIDETVVIHMRLDPPYDTRYQKFLWMLDSLSHQTGCKVINNPHGIMKYNEKLLALFHSDSVPSFIGENADDLDYFLQTLDPKFEELIFKPLELFSGIGVKKFSRKSCMKEIFTEYQQEYPGAIIVQPFIREVTEGEQRVVFMNETMVGAIVKKPKAGEFLANIAQGATFEEVAIEQSVEAECLRLAKDLNAEGVGLIAFDVLGSMITEVNVTCPALLVELEYATGRDMGECYRTMLRESDLL